MPFITFYVTLRRRLWCRNGDALCIGGSDTCTGSPRTTRSSRDTHALMDIHRRRRHPFKRKANGGAPKRSTHEAGSQAGRKHARAPTHFVPMARPERPASLSARKKRRTAKKHTRTLVCKRSYKHLTGHTQKKKKKKAESEGGGTHCTQRVHAPAKAFRRRSRSSRAASPPSRPASIRRSP